MDEHLEELFPFYALGVLSDDECAQVDAYVAADPAARTRLNEALRAAAAVPLSAAPVAPRPAVKAALMNRVNAAARRRAAESAAPPRSRFDLSRLFSPSFFRVVLPLAAAAGLVAAIGLGVWAASLNTEVARLRQVTARLEQQLIAQREVLMQIASPQVQALSISGTEFQPQARGQLLADRDANKAVLIVADLKPLAEDQIYQFWLIRGQTPISAGLFRVNDQGQAILPIEVADAMGSFDAMGVSIEPAGGSAQPTGDIVMLSRLADS
jgi:anti-sigma-K factor RskA